MKRPRIRARPLTASSDDEPLFNMVTLMSAEEAKSLGIEEWSGRNLGLGTSALADEMRRVQAEALLKNAGKVRQQCLVVLVRMERMSVMVVVWARRLL